jgi:predicted ATPase/DNA-binding CsgD family transcriptional regulator
MGEAEISPARGDRGPMAADERVSLRPAGTLTVLVADLDGELIESVVRAHGGTPHAQLDATDGAMAVFGSVVNAVAAAMEVQVRVSAAGLRPRIAVHTGAARLGTDGRYAGAAIKRAGRLRDVAYRGQIVLSSKTASAVSDALPEGGRLTDLGPHRLRDLAPPERVFEIRHRDVPGEPRPLRSLDSVPNNLPVQLTSFVGRRDELAAVGLLLAEDRFVTLTGSGGCGKTRLALQSAAEHADRWPDGVWWVELGPVTDQGLVADVVASATGVLVEPLAGALRTLTLQLRDRRVLVCLDNCEHLVDATAAVADALLRSCPEVSVLATSREPLGVPGEILWRVPSLPENQAVSLFVERAARVRPWFTLDGTNEAAVRTICRRLDGIPLAIELAAAWLSTLTPTQIAAELDNRFSLLARGRRGVIERQQTLSASIDWSHDLLGDIDRVVFRRLGVFSGGFTLDAARAVVADAHALDSLGRLVDKSLVLVDESDGGTRYRLLETIRQYASDRLHDAGERDAARDRHLDHYLALAEASFDELVRADQDAWLARLETEHDNLRAALDWGLSLDDPERGRRLAAALLWLWYLHGYAHEGTEYMQRAIALAEHDRSPVQARLLSGAAAVAIASGQFAVRAHQALQALELATANGDEVIRGRCLLLLGLAQSYVDFDAAQELCRQAQRCAEAAGDPFGADVGLVLEATILANRDRHSAAGPLLRDGFQRCWRRGNRGFATLALNFLDDAAVLTGDVALAERLATEALQIAKPLGDHYTVGVATSHLALAKGAGGDIEAGLSLMAPLVRSVEGAEHGVYIPRMALVLGKLHLWSAHFDDAVEWFERDVRYTGPMAESLIVARALPGLGAALRHLGRMDEAADHLDRATSIARKLGVPHVLGEALEQSALLIAPTNPERAEDLHHEALAVRVDHGLRTAYVDSLDALAALAARAERFTEAARLSAASHVARGAMGYPRPIDLEGHDAVVASLHHSLGKDRFAAAWAEGVTLSLDQAVAYVCRARGHRDRPSTGWASLTPTELDVVRLVLEGLSNPAIGTRLLMSRGTVKTHLSHVYTKVGVSNRTELASLATTRAPFAH